MPSTGQSGGVGGWVGFVMDKGLCGRRAIFFQYHIDAKVTKFECDEVWRVTGFYGEPNSNKRTITWTLLKNPAQQYSRPWLVWGDSNEVIANLDKKGGPPIPAWGLRNMRETLDICELQELDFEGYRFTWANNREAGRFTQLRLDNAAANLDWRGLFPAEKVQHFSTHNSDHAAILLRLRGIRPQRFSHNESDFDSRLCG